MSKFFENFVSNKNGGEPAFSDHNTQKLLLGTRKTNTMYKDCDVDGNVVDSDDIYIMMKCLFVCLSVTKIEHFHELPPSAPLSRPGET